MRIFSFVRKGIDLEKVEVEITLVPGLPNFQIIGLPDAAIRESILKIKSALRNQEFDLPQREQVVVNLRPSHERKSSLGLDLAIAAAYLWTTEQLTLPEAFEGKDLYLYGEVNLAGEVSVPSDLVFLDDVPENGLLITGAGKEDHAHLHGRVKCLRDLETITFCEPQFGEANMLTQVTRLEHYEFLYEESRVLAIAGVGEHNVFVAGPAGTGKTTFSEALHAILRNPSVEEQKKILKIARVTKRSSSDCEAGLRPFVCPHHSSSDVALLGGGVPPWPGEITRAHHGVLVMDEFLEFDNHVKECLREPIEKHEITINRAGNKVTFPADFLLIGTTNLCPCGDYVPGRAARCGYSATYCKSHFRRLSGPLLDRFEMVTFSQNWNKSCARKKRTSIDREQDERKLAKKNLAEIRVEVQAAQSFAMKSRGQTKMNSRLSLAEIYSTIPDFVRNHLLPEMPSSHRRELALLRVARSIADLEGSATILGEHISEAILYTMDPFTLIKQAQH